MLPSTLTTGDGMTDRSSSPDTESTIDWRSVALIAAVALAACLAGIQNDFAQDDGFLIRDNAAIHDLGNVGHFFSSPFWPPPFSPDLYRPLASLLLAMQWAFGSGDAMIYRVISYLLYAAASITLYRLSLRLLSRGAALGVGVLFAAHPVHVEAVALGVAQNEIAVAIIAAVMSTLYVDRRRTGSLAVADWTLLGALYATACLLKEQGFVLPAVLLAAEWLLVAPSSRTVRKKLAAGFLTMTLVGIALLMVRRLVLGDVSGSFVAEALIGLGWAARAVTMLQVVPRWVQLLIWPAHLQADYSPREIVASSAIGAMEILGVALLAAFVTLFVWSRRRAPAIAFGLAWCAIALLPVSNVLLPTGILLAERTLFLPSAGALIAVGGAIDFIRRRVAGAGQRRTAAGVLTAVVILGVARSAERQRVWRNDAFLAVRTVQDAPRSFRAQRAYGDVLLELQQFPLAREAYDRAIALAPAGQAWRVRNDLARSLRLLGDRREEVAQLRASLAQRPDQQDARGFLIAAELALGQYASAAAEADSALARGGSAAVFRGLRAVADSAAKVGAPAGSIRIGINTGAAQRLR
jgi:hypothetical protein